MQIRDYQNACWDWAQRCFSHEVVFDIKERCLRFLEEALELVQACGLTRTEVLRLVDYVYSRPVGEPQQETGGVIITLMVLNSAVKIDAQRAALDEYERIEEKIDKIRIKQLQKPSLRDRDTVVGLNKIKAFLHEHYPDAMEAHKIVDGLLLASINPTTVTFDTHSYILMLGHGNSIVLNLP